MQFLWNLKSIFSSSHRKLSLCYLRKLFISFSFNFIKCRKHLHVLKAILIQSFCRFETEIGRFSIDFRLKKCHASLAICLYMLDCLLLLILFHSSLKPTARRVGALSRTQTNKLSAFFCTRQYFFEIYCLRTIVLRAFTRAKRNALNVPATNLLSISTELENHLKTFNGFIMNLSFCY